MKVLEARNVCKQYAERKVLDGFSIELEPFGFDALMGPSGSGKSTFLHLAAGLISANSGSIQIGGHEVTKMNDSAAAKFRRRHVGVVFQSFNLLESKTVKENILLPLKLDKSSTKSSAIQARLEKLADELNLSDKLDCMPNKLSGGERQRVAIARALIAEPEVILADEPTGNLDVQSAKSVCDILKRINAVEKSAILVVTHDPMVAACAHKVHFLKDGKLASSFETNNDAALVSRKYLETYQ